MKCLALILSIIPGTAHYRFILEWINVTTYKAFKNEFVNRKLAGRYEEFAVEIHSKLH
jgi:hypothetical protein